MKSRIISFILVLVLLVQILPAYVFAEDNTSDTPPAETIEMETGEPGKVVLGEVTDRRGENEKHFHLNDGGFVAVGYGVPVHYSTDGGETWNDIDNTLALSRDDSELYVAENGDSVRGFASDLRTGRLLAVSDGAYGLRFGLPETADNADGEKHSAAVAEISYPDEKTRGNEELPFAEQVTPSKLRAEVLYRNVYDGVDLSYVLYSHDVKESILVNQPRESYAFSFKLDMDELVPALKEDGSIELRNADGKAIYLIPAPYMFDADGTESDAVSYAMEKAESGAWTLTVVADADWINAADRVFPVSIDPTVYFAGDSSNNQIYSGYINDNSPNSHPAYSSSYIRCGNYQNSGATAGHAIGLIYVNKLPKVPGNCVMTTSMLKLFQTHYSNGDDGYYNYPRLYTSQIIDPTFNSNAAESFINSLTWNNLTDKVIYGGGSSPETRTTIDYTKCNINTLNNHYFEITDTAWQWYEGTIDISRLLVLDDGQRNMSIDTRATFSGYGHESFGHQPQLIVFYRNTVGVEGYYDYHTQNIGRAGIASVNNFTLGLNLAVPLISAPSAALPFGLALYYNGPISDTTFTDGDDIHSANYSTSSTGYGWKTSVQQTVNRDPLTGSGGADLGWLIYTDADGTEHYFKQKGQTLNYEDEDGLGLTITVNDIDNPTTFTMKDKEKNTWTFLYGYLSSYEDNNGNALYYAYNGYDYSSGNSNWKPSNASTVYRVTSVWRKNSGVSSATKLVTLNYTNNRLSSIVDMASRTTSFSYDANNNLSTITYPDAKTATYTYSNATVTDPQTNTTKTFHRLTKARDNEAQYEIRYSYWTAITPRVKGIKEYSGAVGSETAGTTMRGFKSNATKTRFRYCGADNTLETDDDIIVHFYFDHWGRPINVVTLDTDETTMFGISDRAYIQNKDVNKENNRMTNAATSGTQSTNLVFNSGFEHLTNNAGDLYGWTASGNGSVSAKATSETTPVLTPRTGAYMMKLYLGSVSAGKESCYQTVYLKHGETYVFSGYVNTAAVSDTGTVGAYLSFRTSSGTDITNASSRILNYKTNTAVDNGWERLEAIFTPSQDGTYQVAVNLSHMANVVLADDLQLEKVTNTGGFEGEASASTANLIQLGGFELPVSSGTSASEVSQFWRFSTDNTPNDITIVEDADENRGKVICLHNAPDQQIRAKQDVYLNAPANRTYLVSAWGKLPAGYTSDGSDLKYNNATYKRFFGIMAKIYYVGYSTPEYQYVAFNSALGGWQYTSGMIVPEKTDRTVEYIELNVTGDLLPNDAYVDDVTLIQEPVQTYKYDENGNLTATSNSEGKTSTEFDTQERLIKYTAMNGVEYNLHYANTTTRNPDYMTSANVKTSYEYETTGSVKKTTVQATSGGKKLISEASYDATKNYVASVVSDSGAVTESTYNTAKGLLETSTNPNGVTTNYMYDANNDRAASTYHNGNEKAYLYYQYDSNGRLKQLNRKDYLGTALTRQGYHFEYDAWGNTTSIKVGSVSSDTSGSLSSSITLASYVYNVNGTLARMNYPGGQYVTYAYDKLDRLIREVYYDSSNTVQADYRYVYNANGQLSKQYSVETANGIESVVESYSLEDDSLGRMIRSREEDTGGTIQKTEHLYDSAGRLAAQNWTIGSNGFSEAYEYRGTDGLLENCSITTTLASGAVAGTDHLCYDYDNLKRLTQVGIRVNSNTNFSYSSNYSYLDYAGSTTRTTSRLGTYTFRNADNAILTGNRYVYDANGNITKIYEVFTVNSTDTERLIAEYEYDELNQLKKETRKTYTGNSTTPTATTVVTYTIDTAGNISSVETKVNGTTTETVEYTYGASYWSDRLTAIKVNGTTKTIGYATYLNPSSWYNGTEYTGLTWTQGRRLSSITKGSSTYSYEYDMSGVRSVKIAGGKRHEYVTQNGRVVRDTVTDASTGAFQYVLDFTYDQNGRPLTMRRYTNANMTNGYTTFRYVCNAQGDVVKLMYSGTAYAEYTYDAWGNVISSSGSLADLNPLRYRSYYFDVETGFYYLQSRYYDPALGRFINADSYASTGQGFIGYNMFAYCGNGPVSLSDQLGHRPSSLILNVNLTDSWSSPLEWHVLAVSRMEKYSENAWNAASEVEKKQLLNDYMNDIAAAMNVYISPEIHFYYADGPSHYGSYNSYGCYMSVNTYYFYDYAESLDTIRHEMRHCYQHSVVDGYGVIGYNSPYHVDPEKKREWAYNIYDYIDSSSDIKKYKNQPIEIDARWFARVTG